MSYDLNFRSRDPGIAFSSSDFRSHFAGRANYEVSDSQAWYANEDSGVYFAFDYTAGDDDDDADDPDDDATLLPVAFNLNYIRPSVFCLEAEPELAAFVKRFNLTVSDPQISGMGDGEYSADGFIRGWNAGNAAGYQSITSQGDLASVSMLPSSTIHSLWRWNVTRNRRQEEIGEAAFVPRIFVFNDGGRVLTGVAWAEGIPVLLPTVDLVLVPRERLAPRKWFRSQNDVVVFQWSELEPIVRRFPRVAGEWDAHELFYEATPSDVERLIREKSPPDQTPTSIPFDQVLDREVMEEAKSS